MSVNVEKLENSMVKLTVTVSAEDFEKALDQAYRKQKSKLQVKGFRKGHVTRQVAEYLYGPAIFYEDAANIAINDSYDDALKDSGEEITSDPSISVTQIEKGKDFIYTAVAAVKPPVKLGVYKGVEIEKVPVAPVTDEDIEKELKKQQDANAKIVDVTDRPVQNGDIIKLDFEGFVDGKPFDGGKAENYELTIGSGTFIPGFEDQLVGVNIGEEKDVKVTFPENYGEESLRGKEAVFKCKVNSIKEKVLPEINDDFADEVSEYSTLDEYKAGIKENLEKSREEKAKDDRRGAAVAVAVSNAAVDIPEAMLDYQARGLASDMERNIMSYGYSVKQYLDAYGLTEDQLVDQMRPQAEVSTRNALVLDAIADAENIEVTDEDIEEEYQREADANKLPLDTIKGYYNTDDPEESLKRKESLKDSIRIRKVRDLIADNAVEVEKKEKPEEAETPKTPAEEAAAPEEESKEASAAPEEEAKPEE